MPTACPSDRGRDRWRGRRHRLPGSHCVRAGHRRERVLDQLVGSTNAPAAEGIYRLDRVGKGTTRTTLIADLYTWSEAHPPASPNFFIPGGYTYSMQAYRNGFLVADAHHNRILRVRLNGRISVFKDFAKNVVPTGLERVGRRTVLVGQAGPVPHTPKTGRVVARRAGGRIERLASGAPLLVDVEVGPQHRLYGLAQGNWPYEGQEGKEGFPAKPNTGHLMLANSHGQFKSVVSGLDRPTTFEIIGDTAFVVTITGKVLRISGLGEYRRNLGLAAHGADELAALAFGCGPRGSRHYEL